MFSAVNQFKMFKPGSVNLIAHLREKKEALHGSKKQTGALQWAGRLTKNTVQEVLLVLNIKSIKQCRRPHRH